MQLVKMSEMHPHKRSLVVTLPGRFQKDLARDNTALGRNCTGNHCSACCQHDMHGPGAGSASGGGM